MSSPLEQSDKIYISSKKYSLEWNALIYLVFFYNQILEMYNGYFYLCYFKYFKYMPIFFSFVLCTE